MAKTVTGGGAALRLKLGWEMRITKAALEPLGNPEYITFLWSAEKRILVITASDFNRLRRIHIGCGNYQYAFFRTP